MKAARYYEPGRMEVDEVPRPDILDDEILIRVRAASICGTDLRILRHGHQKIPPGQHRVLGHEIAGDIVEVGPQVVGYALGSRVAVIPNVGCGSCRDCRAGLNNMCPTYDAFGITIDGGFQEFLRIPGFALARGNVFRMPDSVTYLDAALIEPFSCCYRGQRQISVGFEDNVLIIGAGPIGVFHVILARLAGASRIVVSDLAPARLAIALEFGADAVIDASATDVEEAIRAETGGRGADVVITAASSAAAQAQALRVLAPHGRLNVFAGLASGETAELDTNLIHYRGLTVSGTTGSSYADYDASLRLVADGRARLARLASATFPVERIDEAFAHAASGTGMKAVIVFDGSAPGSAT